MPRRNKSPKIKRRVINTRPNCSDKKIYKDRENAEAAAESQMLTSLTLELGVYKCSDCGGWHLTRQTVDKH